MIQCHMVRFSENILSDAFSSVIFIKIPENADENGDFRKRFQKWSLGKRTVLQTLRF